MIWYVIMSKYGYTNINLNFLKSSSTPLHEASKQGQIYIIKILVKEDITYLDLIDKNGMTPLHYAAVFKQREAYNFLLEQGANDKWVDNFGRTPDSIIIANDDIGLVGDSNTCCVIL